MFLLSAKFRKSQTPGVEGSVYYIIRQGKSERNITGYIRGIDSSIISKAKDRIAFDLMTIYCVIEKMFRHNNTVKLDEIAAAAAIAIRADNPFEERIKNYQSKYPISGDIAKVTKTFSDKFEQIKIPVRNNHDKSGLIGYFSFLIDEYNTDGKHSAKSLHSTQMSLSKYLNGSNIPLSRITHSFVSGYNTYLTERVSMATASSYLRVLHTVLKRAEKENLMPKVFYWPSDIKTTVLRNSPKSETNVLDIKTIRRIEQIDLSYDESLEFARDVFMFGFYAQGMEFIDVANLRISNLEGNVLTYRRRLKGNERNVILGEKALAIIDKYFRDGNEYMFPILKGRWLYSYPVAKARVMVPLRKIGQILNLPCKLTFGMNIYSWHSIIRTTNITELFIT